MSVYSTGTRVLAAVAWVFCAFFAVNLMMTGTATSIWHFLPVLTLVAWAIFLVLWRPRLLIQGDGLTVVNILRSHLIPFGALRAVRVGQSVILDTTAGRVASWGAPGAGRLGPRLGRRPETSNSVPVTAHARAAVDTAWNAWEQKAQYRMHDAGAPLAGDDTPAVTTRWDVGSGVVSLVLLAVVAVSLLS